MQSTAIQVAQNHGIEPAGSFFSPDQERIILDTFLGGASKAEAQVLLATVQRRRLDPFSRQVYFVNRWDNEKGSKVWAIQTSIDGLRAIAERTGKYEGQTKAEWCGPDGKWLDVWLSDDAPAAARVGVHRAGCKEPLYGVARLKAYRQTKKDGSPTRFWQIMPDTMLAKCAEALALRKAFPEDTGGLYIGEEMGKDQGEEVAAEKTPVEPDALPNPRVQVVRPSEEPKAEPQANTAMGLWEALIDSHDGDKSKATADWTAAIDKVWPGVRPPLGKNWTSDDVAAVRRALWPEINP